MNLKEIVKFHLKMHAGKVDFEGDEIEYKGNTLQPFKSLQRIRFGKTIDKKRKV